MNAGSFDDLNIEALVATEPDMALVGVSSDKGNAQIAEVGIPTYVMLIGWAAIDTLKQEFLNVGKILGNEEKAQRLVDEADVVLVNGGSSRGSEDFNSEHLQERASWFSHGVKAVPGRPIGLAVIEGKLAINVPEPMIAAYLAADWLLQGLVCHYYGQPVPQRVKVSAVLDTPLGARPGFEHLARLVAHEVDGVLHAAPAPNSATLVEDIRSVSAFLAVPAGTRYAAGDTTEVELLGTKAG